MAPRGVNRVRIVSPNSGSVCYSRSVSRGRQNNTDSDYDYDDTQTFSHTKDHRHQRSTSGSSSILKKQSSFGRGEHARTALATLPHNQSGSRPASVKSQSRSLSAPVRSAAAIEAAYAADAASRSVSYARRGRLVYDEEEDERAIERAQEALNAAGTHVLKRPFGQQPSAPPPRSASRHTDSQRRTPSASTSLSVPPPLPQGAPALSRSTSRAATHRAAAGNETTNRSLKLPRTIPVTRSRSSHASSADFRDLLDDSEGADFQPLKRRRREERKPAMPAYMTTLLASRKPAAPTKAAPTGAKASAQARAPSAPALPPARSAPTVARSGPCPGMFSGLSSIAVDDNLFAGAFPVDEEAKDQMQSLHTSSGTSGGKTAATPSVPMRRCSRPLWCLVGTFKTGLSSVVSVDPTHDRLHWQQRNPRGGFQSIRVPLSCVLDAFVARVTQTDEDIQERQFTVVIRTSARPSQVVFGFRTVTEANQFLKMVTTA